MIFQIGKYSIQKMLYQSSNSLIYRATNEKTDEKCILKMINKEYPSLLDKARYQHEFKILNQLSAPGVISCLGLEKYGQNNILVLEDINAISLDLYLKENKKLPLDIFFKIAPQIIKTLGAIHHCNIIHKDINPRNIILNSEELTTKIIDFDIATELTQERQCVDAKNILQGSLAYISPEQTGRMNRFLDYRSDYYSLGLTFYFLLTGQHPFKCKEPLEWIHAHIAKEPVPIGSLEPDIPSKVVEVIEKLISKNPEDRYQSSYGILKDFEFCLHQWTDKGEVEDFELAKWDVSEKFQVSDRLFGREQELDLLSEKFSEVSKGKGHFLLVTGQSGIGKSALIREINKQIIRNRGSYIEGKFDQFKRNIPYSALKDCFRMLIQQLLATSSEELEQVKNRIQNAISPNGKLIVDLIPELERIIGPQNEISEINSKEAQNRFFYTFKKFISALTSTKRTIVIFLDDLQWADDSTLKLLEYLIGSVGCEYLFIIGAYRDNEINEAHPLSLLIEEIGRNQPINKIFLEGLKKNTVDKMLVENFHSEKELLEELSDYVYGITRGNPFFINELLKDLYNNKCLNFISEEGKWFWDREKTKEINVGQNVANFLLQQLKKLPENTKEVLQYASCIGNSFDLKTLTYIKNMSRELVLKALWDALRRGIIFPLSDNYQLVNLRDIDLNQDFDDFGVRYKFQHDRVHQAAHLLLDENIKEQIHLELGRLLIKSIKDKEERDEKIIEMAYHFNQGICQVKDNEEILKIIEINLEAGIKAKNAIAFKSAVSFLEKGKELLSSEAWEEHYALTMKLYKELAICLYIEKRFDEALKLLTTAEKKSTNKFEKVHVYFLYINLYFSQGAHTEAIEYAVKGLNTLGYKISTKISKLKLMMELFKVKVNYIGTSLKGLKGSPIVKDEKQKLIARLLSKLTSLGYFGNNRNLGIFCSLALNNHFLKYGVSTCTAAALTSYGASIQYLLNDYRRAKKLSELAFHFAEKLKTVEDQPSFLCSNAGLIHLYNHPWSDIRRVMKKAMEVSYQAGDHFYVAFAARMALVWSYDINLDTVLEEGEQLMAVASDTKVTAGLICAKITHQYRRCLKGLTISKTSLNEEDFDEEEARNILLKEYPAGMSGWHLSRIILNYLHENFTQSYEESLRGEKVILNTMTTAYVVEYIFFDAIIIVEHFKNLTKKEQVKATKRFEKWRQKMEVFSKHNPDNFQFFLDIMDGQWARLNNDREKAFQLLLKARDQLKNLGMLFYEGISLKMLAQLYFEKGQKLEAGLFYSLAITVFRNYGATAIVNTIEQSYGQFIQEGQRILNGHKDNYGTRTRDTEKVTYNNSSSSSIELTIDIDTIVKAARTLTEEMNLDKLLLKLMQLCQYHAGADKGQLFLYDEKNDMLKPCAVICNQEKVELVSDNSKDHFEQQYCHAVVNLVLRGKETIILEDACDQGDFVHDYYIKSNEVKSVLCMPIFRQNQFIGILYLENAISRNAFTRQHLKILNIISSQAAISIENVELYHNLELKVQERTQQLAQKNRDIQSMLENLRQGIFTITSDGAIHHEYSKYLEHIFRTNNVAGLKALDFLLSKVQMGSDQRDQIESFFTLTLGEDSIQHEINSWLLPNELVLQHSSDDLTILEVDWEPIVNEENEIIEKMMVIVRDVTSVRELQREAENQRYELKLIDEILSCSIIRFKDFLNNSQLLINECLELLSNKSVIDQELIQHIYRNIHTIKGNARMLQLNNLTDQTHDFEQILSKIVEDEKWDYSISELEEGLKKLKDDQNDYRNLIQTKLKSLDTKEFESKEEVTDQSLFHLFEGVLSSVDSVAKELDRAVPQVCFEGDLSKIDKKYHDQLVNIFMHLVRNSLDHGIEKKDDRINKGLPARGTLKLKTLDQGNRIHLYFSDDGQGLDLKKIKEKALKLNLLKEEEQLSDIELANFIFHPNFSTKDHASTISGRGVGMDYIKNVVQKELGEISICLKITGDSDVQYRPFEFFLDLPKN